MPETDVEAPAAGVTELADGSAVPNEACFPAVEAKPATTRTRGQELAAEPSCPMLASISQKRRHCCRSSVRADQRRQGCPDFGADYGC